MFGDAKAGFRRLIGLVLLAMVVALIPAASARASNLNSNCVDPVPAGSSFPVVSPIGTASGPVVLMPQTGATGIMLLDALTLGCDDSGVVGGGANGMGPTQNELVNPSSVPLSFTTSASASVTGATYMFTPLACDTTAGPPFCVTDMPSNPGCSDTICGDTALGWTITVVSTTPAFLAAASDTITLWFDPNGDSSGPGNADLIYNTEIDIPVTLQQPLAAAQAVASTILTQNHAAVAFKPVTATGGAAPLSFSVMPSLPSGLSLDSTSGQVSGTPTATLADTSFTVTVTDANNHTASASFDLTVNSAVLASVSAASTALTQNHVASFKPINGSGGTGSLSYSITPALPSGLVLDTTTGTISGTPSATLTATIFTVTVTDANLATASNSFSLAINSAVAAAQTTATEVLTINQSSASFKPVSGAGGTGSLLYSVAPALPAGLTLNAGTGTISGSPTVTHAVSSFTVTVTDANSATASQSFSLTINGTVVASQAVASISLTQNHPATAFTPVTATGGTAPLVFSVGPSLPAGLSLASGSGAITGTPIATITATNFTVTATDTNGVTGSASFSLAVNSAVTATQAVASTVLTQNHAAMPFIPVTGAGGTGARSFSVAPPLPAGLSLASATGTISGTPIVTLASSSFTMTVTDTNGATATQSFSLAVNGAVTASQAVASAILTENQAATPFTPVTGGGGTGSLSFSIAPSLPSGLSFSSATGAVSGTPTATLAATSFGVTVTDANGATATQNFSLTVNGPLAASQAVATKVLTENHAAVSFTPVTASGGTAPLSFAVAPSLPAGLTLATNSGAITGTPTVAIMATNFTVTVTDANNSTANANFSLTVNGPVTAMQAVPSTVLTQNHAATAFTPVTGGGGTGSLSFSVAPSLPAGLALNATTGAISGTPSAALAASVFVITVTDTNGATATQTFSLAVNGPVVATQAVATKSLTQNQPATSFTPVTGSGGTGSLSFSVAPALPSGLSLNAATGAVSGAPTVVLATTSFTMTVTDTNGATATQSFSLTVNGPPAAVQLIATKGVTVNQPVVAFKPVNGTGGTPALNYSVAPTLPAGLAMAPATGTISGLPTASSLTTTFTVTVTDANGVMATAGFNLAVNGPVLASGPLAATVLTQNHATPGFTPVSGSGGTTPYSFSVAPALPAGLSLASATGTITGTPGVAIPATSFTVTVTDADGATASAGFSLTVDQAVTATLAVPSTTLPVNRPATPFAPVTGGGGAPPLSFSVSPALPAGLSLAANSGLITGTPTAALATSPFTVTVTDANGATATASFTLGVTTLTSATAAASSTNPSTFGQTVTLTATVSSTGGAPTGTVTFRDGAATIFTGTLAGPTTSFTTASLTVGTHFITMTYNGDRSFAGSSTVFSQTVNPPIGPIAGQVYAYQTTLGTPGVAQADNSHFSAPVAGAVDTVRGHLFIADTLNHRVQIVDTTTLDVIGTIGVAAVAGADNAHLNQPGGVGFDEADSRILVADTGNQRIQVFDATSFAYLATLGSAGIGGTDAAHFNAPTSAHVNAATQQLYVADSGNHRIQIFDAGSFTYVATLGVAGIAGSDAAHLDQPHDAEFNPGSNQIMVADSGNSRIQLFDAASFAYDSTIGGPTLNLADNDYFATPVTAAFDPSTNLVLIADAGIDDRIQVFDALTYDYVLTLGATGSSGAGNGQFAGPLGIAIDPPHAHIFVGDQQNDRVQSFAIAPPVNFAAILPGSRSVQLGHAATVFASMVNAGASSLDNCRIALPVAAPAGLALSYQTTNPATNALTGAPDTPVSIAADNGLQTFLISLTGTEPFSAPGMPIDFACAGVAPAAVTIGVDTVDLVMSTTPIADVIALAATPTNNGIVEVPAGGAGAFAVASTNVGIAAPIIVSADTGDAALPLALTICQSNPQTGQCLAAPSPTVSLEFAAAAAPTFSVFLQASGAIPFDPAQSRVFLRFKDAAGGLHGSTSVAVETK
jgi:hypothetical protein